jgi:two-component system catabolic regulation response regulator CreB
MSLVRQTILVVEDEALIAQTIIYALNTEGYQVVWRTTGHEALGAIEGVALVILDVGLPDMSGFEVCRQMRRQRDLAVIFLTARSEEVDRIVGLELGADDYVAKPFSPRELTARVRAVLRRARPDPQPLSSPRDQPEKIWVHDRARCRISYRGHPLDLTRNEYRLLGALVEQPGRVFTRDQLMAAAWEDPSAALDRTVDAHIKTVRAKLRGVMPEHDPIITHRGLGYSLREE